MALNGYLKYKGQKSGDVKGSVTQKGRENSIEIIAVSHSIISPRDMASGLPTGKRMHKPIVVTHELDASVPVACNILCGNENIVSWKLDFYSTQIGNDRTTGTNLEQNYYSIELVNASIASIDFRMANNKHPDLMKFKEYVEVAFVYEKITGTWIKGGISFSDDWAAPQQ
jgi:type VI secretion system secreted protein Hcp